MPSHQPPRSLDSRIATTQPQMTVATLLANSGCDLGDEREVMRTLQSAFPTEDATCFPDHAIELAREIRAAGRDLQH